MKISKQTILWCAILVIVFVQAPHLANEFAEMSSLPKEWMRIAHGSLFAIAIDASVLLFAVRGREWETALFMIASFVITLQYYAEYLAFKENWLLASTTVMISMIGVLSVFFLSREINKVSQDDDEIASLKKRLMDSFAEKKKLEDEKKKMEESKSDNAYAERDSDDSITSKQVKALRMVKSGIDIKEICENLEITEEDINLAKKKVDEWVIGVVK